MPKSEQNAEMKKLMERSPGEVREETKALAKRYKDCWSELAKLLYRIKMLKDYTKWKYDTFEAYVEGELGLEPRTVRYWLSTYDKLVFKLGISEDKLKGKAWSKIRYIVPVVDKDNANKWIDKAERLSQPELAATVHQVLEGKPEPDEKTIFTPFSVRLSPDQRKTVDQAVEMAKKLSPHNNDADGHAVEMICLNFLGDNFTDKKDALAHMLGKIESVFRIKLLVIDKENPNWKDTFEQARTIVRNSCVKS